MLYREIIPVCSHIHTKHINTLCEQNLELLNVKTGASYSNHWALKQVSGINVRSSASHPLKTFARGSTNRLSCQQAIL
jgi:hypothetical protein